MKPLCEKFAKRVTLSVQGVNDKKIKPYPVQKRKKL